MNVKAIAQSTFQECISLFHNLRLYSKQGDKWMYPSIYTCEKSGDLVVLAPHSIRLEQFEKSFEGLSTILNRPITGSRNLGGHCWLLLENRLPDLVPYSSRPENIPKGQYWLGTYEDGSPVILAFEHSPIFLVAGASGSGKSELFKVLLKEIENTWGADSITIAEGAKDGNDFRHQLATELGEVVEACRELYDLYEK